MKFLRWAKIVGLLLSEIWFRVLVPFYCIPLACTMHYHVRFFTIVTPFDVLLLIMSPKVVRRSWFTYLYCTVNIMYLVTEPCHFEIRAADMQRPPQRKRLSLSVWGTVWSSSTLTDFLRGLVQETTGGPTYPTLIHQ